MQTKHKFPGKQAVDISGDAYKDHLNKIMAIHGVRNTLLMVIDFVANSKMEQTKKFFVLRDLKNIAEDM